MIVFAGKAGGSKYVVLDSLSPPVEVAGRCRDGTEENDRLLHVSIGECEAVIG